MKMKYLQGINTDVVKCYRVFNICTKAYGVHGPFVKIAASLYLLSIVIPEIVTRD